MNTDTTGLPQIHPRYAPVSPPLRHQYEALVKGWQRDGFAYLLEMGLGKSRVLIDDFCLNFVTDRVQGLLVVAPKNVYTNWTRMSDEDPGEIQKWLWPELRQTAVVATYRAGRSKNWEAERVRIMDPRAPGVRILVMNVEALASAHDAGEVVRQFYRAHRTMIAVDESFTIKNPSAARTKLLIQHAKSVAKRRILTGFVGQAQDTWSQFEFLAPGESLLGNRTFVGHRTQYCLTRDIVVNGHPRKIITGPNPATIAELGARIADHAIRRRKRDCMDLPDKIYRKREIELTKEQRDAYSEMKASAMATIRGSEVTTNLVITQMMRLQQIVCGHIKTDEGQVLHLANNRVSSLMEVLEGTNEPTVIWSAYRPDIETIVAALRKEYGSECYARWHGGLTDREREEGEEEFKSGKRRFMISTGARGRSWTNSQFNVFYSTRPDLEIRLQSEDRTHRLTTTESVVYLDFYAPGTIDEKIMRAMRAQKDIAHLIMQDGAEAWL